MITSDMLKNVSAGVGFLNQYNESKNIKSSAALESRKLLFNARMRENEGVRQSAILRGKTRSMVGDASSAMVSQSGITDPEMLARIKMRGDYNSMASIYEARADANEMRGKAAMAKISGDLRSSTKMLAAGSTLMSKWSRGAGQNVSYLSDKDYKAGKKGVKIPYVSDKQYLTGR